MKVYIGWVALAVLSLLSFASAAPQFPDGYKVRTKATMDAFATDFCFLTSIGRVDRILITMKSGLVLYYGGRSISKTPFLDLREQVNTHHDRGLSACAVHPRFRKTRQVFFMYTYENEPSNPSTGKTGQVARYKVNSPASTANKASKKVILGTHNANGCKNVDLKKDVLCADTFTHATGALEFDDRGNLLVSMGDGGDNTPTTLALRAQSIDNLSGKILRVTTDGFAVPGNPFFTNGVSKSANRAKVWSLGSRNPWRLYFDPLVRLPVAVDVGWGTFEEVNIAFKGTNHGWPCTEGVQTSPGYRKYTACKRFNSGRPRFGEAKKPTIFFNHNIGAAASAVARVGRLNSMWPSQDTGYIYYTDYVFNWMYRFKIDRGGNVVKQPEPFATELDGPVAMKLSPTRRVYYMALNARELRVIKWAPDNKPPRVVAVSPANKESGVDTTTSIRIILSKSVDPPSVSSGFTLSKAGSNSRVSGTVDYQPNTRTANFVPAEPLEGRTQYSIVIKGLKDKSGRKMTSSFTSTFTTGSTYTRYVSDMKFLRSKNANGPIERDQSNGDADRNDGETLRIRGIEYKKGLGMTPNAFVVVKAPKNCRTIEGSVGIDDSVINLASGSTVAEVRDGGKVVFQSEALSRRSDVVDFSANVTPGKEVELRITLQGFINNFNENSFAWGDVRFRCGSSSATISNPLKVVDVKPKDGARSVSVNTRVEITFSRPVDQTSLLSAVRVRKVGSGDIPYAPTFLESSTKMSLKLDRLDYNARYSVLVGVEARDLGGVGIDTGYATSFTTDLEPATGLRVWVDDLEVMKTSGNAQFAKNKGIIVPKRGRGRTMRHRFGKGIEIRAPNTVRYNLSGMKCNSFRAYVGIDARVDGLRAHARVTVVANGQKLYTGTFKGKNWYTKVKVNIENKPNFEIRTSPVSGNFDHEYVAFGNANFRCNGKKVYLSDLRPSNNSSNVYEDRNFQGRSIQVRLPPFKQNIYEFRHGVRQHAKSSVTLKMPGRCSTMKSWLGISYLSQHHGDIRFEVTSNGFNKNRCRSNVVYGNYGVSFLECPVEGASAMTLTARRGYYGSVHDIGIWGGAKLDCAKSALDPKCTFVAAPSTFKVKDDISFAAEAVDFRGRKVDKSQMEMSVLLHHCDSRCHVHMFDEFKGKAGGSFEVPDHGGSFYFELQCKACDQTGKHCGVTSKTVQAEVASITVDTVPSGMPITIGAISGKSPMTTNVVVNSKVSLTASNSGTQKFLHWAHSSSAGATTQVSVNSGGRKRYLALYRSR